jgi:RHS repeat-associated protein
MDATQLSFASKGIEDLAIQHQVDVNPLTGSADISLPLPLTPGRSGFTPSLTLQYGSSAGNSVFGVGWSLSGLSSIGLSSKDHLPKYDGKDKFAFNGEELVPVLTEQESGEWVPRIDELDGFRVHYYRLKVEQAYIRFEKWVHKDSGSIHWRTRDRNNVISVYGLDSSGVSRISDPYDESRTWAWLLEAQYDTNGNAIVYEYAPENSDNLDASKIFERDRVLNSFSFPQRYLKRICYGNTQPISADIAEPDGNQWLFEVVLDFGDHTNASHVPDQSWPLRIDPYSTFLPGFEVRTYRLCRRIMMFHRFEELGTQPSLVWITAFDHHEDAAGTTLQSVQHTGFRTDLETGEISQQSLPPLTFNYALPQMGESFHSAPEQTKENFPNGLSDFRFRWVDLYGEGLPGILTETDQAWYYKSNYGNGVFGPQERVIEKPSQRLGSYALSDFDQDGNFNLVVLLGRQAGFCEYDRHTDQWNSFRPFLSAPNLDVAGANTQLLDINGNGRPDILVSRYDCYTLYPLEGKEGFGEPVEFAKPQTAGAKQPQTIAEDPELDLFFADMTGDGLLDQVRIQNGRVEYWPQIGHGRFGDVILMENVPIFDFDTEFDPGRLRLVDIDGSGTTDIVYIGRGEVRYWINACGNSFIEGGRLTNLPYIDNLSTVSVLDFLGDGTPCLVWSSALPGNAGDPIHYLQLTSGVKPRLLLSIDNSMGRQDILTYSSSGTHFLRDKNNGRKWISRLPSHTTVVDKKEVIDQIGNSCFVSRYEYHDGYFDGEERIFRGFGMVEQYDSEFFENTQNIDEADYSAPVCIRSWYHNGMFGWDTRRAELYYSNDPDQAFLPTHTFEDLAILKPKEFDDGFRCLAGQMVRQEVFASSPEGILSDHPYQVTQSTHTIRRLQPSTDKDDACFTFHMSETLTHEYDRQPQDPRITHQLVLDVDPYGNTRSACSIAYPRRSTISDRALAQQLYYTSASCNEYINIDKTDRYEVGIPFENREFELSDILPGEPGIFSLDEVKTGIDAALESPLDFNETFAPVSSNPQARIISWNRVYFWNNGMTEPLPLGMVGGKTLLHHEKSACFNGALISDIFNGRIDPDSLSVFYYEFRDGYWWQPGPVLHYHSADGFFSLAREVRADGGETQYTYDEPYFLTLTEIHDALGNRTSAEINYNVVAPFRITDPNNNISEVLYDPLGATMVSTFQGSILGPLDSPEIYGNDGLSEYALQPDADFSAILAEPSRFLQNAGQFVFYELDSWSESEPGQPLRSISLVREENVYDGAGGGAPDSRIRIIVSYADGFGRALQSKQKVEPGLVIRRDGSGAVVLDSDGRPEEEHADERWLVSGHTVYNNKQQPVRQYEPFFSSTPIFEPDSELRHYGVSDHLRYDSIGRMIRQDLPNGTLSRVETTPWEIRTYDPNDTVDDSEYRHGRETLPDGDQEKNALLKALVHADTPSIVRLDPLGREIIQVESDRDGLPRITESRLDIQGNVTSITDPRDLAAFTYCYDMQGRLLFEHSIDAGDKWIFMDALERPVHQWDGRGVHQQFECDRLGRPVSVFAHGAPGLNQVVEQMVYDEDGSGLAADLKNSRGRLVTHYDQAGIQNIVKYNPEGNPLKTERQLFEKQLLEKYSSEPNWTDIPSASFEPDGVFTTETVYDALGRVTEQRPPDGTTRTTEYLPGGGIASVRVTTADGVLSDAEFLREAAYNARGQQTGAVLGNGVEISYGYDSLTFRMNRLTSVLPASAPGGPKTIQDIEYTFDPVGNIVHFVDHAQQPEPVHSDIMQGLHVSSHCEFTYDAFYQLEEATGRVHQALRPHDYRSDPLIENAIKGTRHLHLNNGAAVERYRRTYGYDLSGNIQFINHAGSGAGADSRSWNTEIWTSPSSNRSLPFNDSNGIPVTNPETRFDANGNNIYMPHLRRIDWNYRNNISCAVIIDRSEEGLLDDAEYYVYGGDGMRVRKIMENLTNREEGTVEITEKIYLDGCEIKRIHRNDTLILERISSHVSDGTNRIAILHQWNEDASSRETEDISEKKTHYQLSNHLGSSSMEINELGEIISYEEYFPFGGTAFIAGDRVKEVKLKEYRYSGKERDDATGFYYYGYRYYAPWIGNWLSPDPIGPEDSLNLYLFVGNNPVNLVDFDGLCDSCTCSATCFTPDEEETIRELSDMAYEYGIDIPWWDIEEGRSESREYTYTTETGERRRVAVDVQLDITPTEVWGGIRVDEEPLEPPPGVTTVTVGGPNQAELEHVEECGELCLIIENPESEPLVEPTTEPESPPEPETPPEPEAPEMVEESLIEDPFELLKRPQAYTNIPQPRPTMLVRPSGVDVPLILILQPIESISPTERMELRGRGAIELERARSYALRELPPTEWEENRPDDYVPVFEPSETRIIGWQRSRPYYQEIRNRSGEIIWTDEIAGAVSEPNPLEVLIPGFGPARGAITAGRGISSRALGGLSGRGVSYLARSGRETVGRARAIPLHRLEPWYRYMRPRYDARVEYVATRSSRGRHTFERIGQIARHEAKHCHDIRAHAQLTYLKGRRFFPGSGMARYGFERRAYRYAGEYRSILTPLRSMNRLQKANLAMDIGIVVGGPIAAGYSWYDLYNSLSDPVQERAR